jgi:4'-phosphopantetheinyl transferase
VERIVLNAHEIHLWLAYDEQVTDGALLDRYQRLLDPAEQAQQRRFHFARHRHQYLIARALLRSTLSLYADAVAPAQWRFCSNRYGKPAIANVLAAPLCFHLAHTERVVALAVSSGGELGVDVESLQRRGDMLGIADRIFSPLEVYQLYQLPPAAQRARFFDFWTLKEAYIKACGKGLTISLRHFSYVIADNGLVDIVFEPQRNDRAERWQFWQVAASAGHTLALAYRGIAPRRPCALVMREVVPLAHCTEVAHPFTRSLPPLY